MNNEMIKQIYANKYKLAQLVSEHLKEFEGLSIEEIMNCFIKNPLINEKKIYIPSYNGEDLYYSIYFKMKSPLLEYNHEIICALEFREKEDKLKNGELPATAGMALTMLMQANEENHDQCISERCYGFYVYTNPSVYLRNTQNRFNIHIKSSGKEILKNHTCVGVEIFLNGEGIE